jgi:hypothetical protein
VVNSVIGIGATRTEPDLTATQAQLACSDVIARFFKLVDGGQASKTMDLFTHDAVMKMGDISLSGDALRAAMAGRETDGVRRVHVASPSSFRLTADGSAEAETLLQLFVLGEDQANGPKSRALTRLNDRFVRGDDHVWRLAERVVTVLAGGE